jgi:hypothetical protein
MIQLFSRLMKLPVEAFVYSMEMFVKTMRGMQHIAYQSIDTMADWDAQAPVVASSRENTTSEGTYATPESVSIRRMEATHTTTQEEEMRMQDKDLREEDILKLVRYKILFVKRDLEHAFPEKEELISENTDAAGYTAWKIAEFIQDLKNVEIPRKWRDKKYPPPEIESPPTGDPTKINSLPEEDKKYLRVYYEVLERYPRERFRYQERQIEVLEQIRDKI